MIAESHVAMHTWPHFNKAFLEIASCKEYDSEIVINTVKRYFPNCEVQAKGFEM
jgi:S-adenosylmethionine/arginine decarboxylase-like enzyme